MLQHLLTQAPTVALGTAPATQEMQLVGLRHFWQLKPHPTDNYLQLYQALP